MHFDFASHPSLFSDSDTLSGLRFWLGLGFSATHPQGKEALVRFSADSEEQERSSSWLALESTSHIAGRSLAC